MIILYQPVTSHQKVTHLLSNTFLWWQLVWNGVHVIPRITLDHARADDLRRHIYWRYERSELSKADWNFNGQTQRKLIVNWDADEPIWKQSRWSIGPLLLKFGSYSLHIAHGALQTCREAIGFDISHLKRFCSSFVLIGGLTIVVRHLNDDNNNNSLAGRMHVSDLFFSASRSQCSASTRSHFRGCFADERVT